MSDLGELMVTIRTTLRALGVRKLTVAQEQGVIGSVAGFTAPQPLFIVAPNRHMAENFVRCDTNLLPGEYRIVTNEDHVHGHRGFRYVILDRIDPALGHLVVCLGGRR